MDAGGAVAPQPHPHPPEHPRQWPAGPRVQTTRFLRETLHKLSEDSVRAASPPGLRPESAISDAALLPATARRSKSPRSPPRAASPPEPPPWEPRWAAAATAAPSPVPSQLASDMGPWGSELDDAGAIAALGAVPRFLHGWSSQFLEWRRNDDLVVARLQGEICELVEANRSMHNFLEQYVTTAEFTGFREAMADYATLVAELAGAAQGNSSKLLAVVERSVDAAVSRGMGELISQLGVKDKEWRDVAEEQHTRWSSELNGRTDQVQERLKCLAEETAKADLHSQDRFERMLAEVTERVDASTRAAAREIGESTLQASRAVAESMAQTNVGHLDGVLQHVTGLIVGPPSDGKPGAAAEGEPLRRVMERFDERLCCGVTSHEQAEHWREEAERIRVKQKDAQAHLEKSQGEAAELATRLGSLGEELRAREAELGEAKSVLEGPVAWQKLAGQVEKVRARGRLKVDLQEGEIEILAGMEFQTKKGTDATAELRDAASAEAALKDAAELLKGFAGVQASIESHVKQGKGSAAYWDQLAVNRAELIKERLGQSGVATGQLTIAGLPGNKGLNRPCIRIRLALFAPKQAPPDAKGKRGQSPKR